MSSHCCVHQLNVPLELAGLDNPGVGGFGSDYRDQGLLHTTGDPWLELRVLASHSGTVCICHHYIYKVLTHGQSVFSA